MSTPKYYIEEGVSSVNNKDLNSEVSLICNEYQQQQPGSASIQLADKSPLI